MTLQQTRERILTDDTFVLSEIERLQYLMQLKRVIRHDLVRAEDDLTESVAEHVCAMCFLAQYFLQIEPRAESLESRRVFDHIIFHDTDELETGDVPTNKKTDADRAAARAAQETVFKKSPAILEKQMRDLYQEFEAQTHPVAKFVKALDKLEGEIHNCYDRQRPIFQQLQFTLEDHKRTKDPYFEGYPILLRFHQVIQNKFVTEKFFYKP